MFRNFIPPLPITWGHHAMAWTCALNRSKFSLGGETRRERGENAIFIRQYKHNTALVI
jgi:hypothetical protein